MSEKLSAIADRPVMTTGLETGLTGRPLVGRWNLDPHAEHNLVFNVKKRLPGGEPDITRAVELERIRDSLNTIEKKKVFDFIADLDADISLAAIAERLALVTTVAPDKNSPMGDRIIQGGASGAYAVESRMAFIPIHGESISNEEKHVSVHEYFHASSSHIYTQKGEEVSKVSLGIERYSPAGRQFTWLNEAITEELTIMLAGEMEAINDRVRRVSYQGQRELLHEIMRVSGIDFRYFLEAYFEEPDLNAPPGERMPKWHALQSKLTEAFGPQFLQKIEELVGSKSGESRSYKDFRDTVYNIRLYKEIWEGDVRRYGNLPGAKKLALKAVSMQARKRRRPLASMNGTVGRQ